jgi:deazaflavin-dependent oxidoreductase (nitroreductase family)
MMRRGARNGRGPGRVGWRRLALRDLLKLVNRFLLVPIFRLGLGRFVGNPASGYYMVVRTVGRKTGRTRYAPVTYAIFGGCVYCLAGYGRTANWYRNAVAAPNIRLILPGRRLDGRAEEVTDPVERLTAIRRIFRNAGLMGFTEGFDPFRDSDETVRARTAEMPVLRVRPADAVRGGAFDPGGRGWLLVPGVLSGLVGAAIVMRLRGPSRRPRRARDGRCELPRRSGTRRCRRGPASCAARR